MEKIKNLKFNSINKVKLNEKDKGSVQVQIASLSCDIDILTKHLTTFKKDFHSKLGLIKKVNKRKKLLKYLKKKNINKYNTIIEQIGLRK